MWVGVKVRYEDVVEFEVVDACFSSFQTTPFPQSRSAAHPSVRSRYPEGASFFVRHAGARTQNGKLRHPT